MANIFDLSAEEFRAVLPELASQGVDTDALVREYRRKNSALAPVYGLIGRVRGGDAEAGRERANILPMTRPAGTTGLEALLSGEAKLAVPGALLGAAEGTAMGVDAPAAASRGLIPMADAPMEALGTASIAMLGGGAAAAPRGALGSNALRRFDVSRKDSSDIFGKGSERVRYTDPDSGGTMEVVVRPDGSASVLELEVPEASRGQGIGQSLQARVMQDYPVMGGQVSSKAAATTAYRLGRRPYGLPDATLEDVFRMIDEDSSVNLISPAAQPNTLPAARNEAERMARDILELRAAGRASEVTDEMMAQADPQYMFANTPLPMDYESRMSRAIGQGFDVNDEMYRGDAPRQSFETGRGQRDKIGVTGSSRPDVAASYIPPRGEGGIYPLVSRGQNDAIIDAERQNWNVIRPETEVEFQGDISPLGDYLPEDYFEPYDVLAGTDFLDTNDLSRMFQGYGADRVKFEDVVDRGGSAKYYGPESSMPSDVTMVANPTNVRSRFARFDPEFSHLANLSAANASPGVGLLQMYQQQQLEERARRRGLLP
jgi:hypothetical protein